MERPAIDVSITIATCSRGPMLRQTLEHLLPQAEAVPFRTEFVIVDDGSIDSTADVLRDFERRAQVPVTIVRGEGAGIAAARNLLVQHSSGTWLACCDDDQIPAEHWLFSLYEAALRCSADFVGGSIDLCLPKGFALRDYGPRARRLLGEAALDRREGQYPVGQHPATNNVLMRAAAVRDLGGFDVSFTQGGEDTDLFARARARGYTLWCAPRARMQHILTRRRVIHQGLRWTSMRIAAGDARIRFQRGRRAGLARLAVRRLAVSAGRDLPLLALAALLRHRVDALDAKCSLWYTEGVLRSLRTFLRPETRKSQAFLQHMDFRRRNGERTA